MTDVSKKSATLGQLKRVLDHGDSRIAELKGDIVDIENNLGKSKNLYDVSKSVSGYLAGGNISANDTYITSDYIPVDIAETYYFSNNGVPIEARCIAKYELRPSGNYAFLHQYQNLTEFTIPSDTTTHIRVTFSVDYDKAQIETNGVTQYVPYQEFAFINDTKKRFENIKELLDNHAINNGQSYPIGLRNGFIVYYKSDIETFNSFLISRGTLSKEYVSVGNTQIVYKSGDGDTSTVPHNITWKDKCDVIIEGVDLGHTKVTLITNGGMFSHTFDRAKGYGNEGVWETTGNGTLSCQISKPNDIWVIGDSYMSYADNRIGGALYEIGQTKPTIISVPGANTVYMASEFDKMINCYGVYPKTLVLCTGMNDTEESYKQGLSTIESICKEYNIELIATAIPITPLRTTNNLNVRNYVLTLNYPIVRFDIAVGSSDSGVWLDNCLSFDNVHPTQNGARLLAYELLSKVGYLVN